MSDGRWSAKPFCCPTGSQPCTNTTGGCCRGCNVCSSGQTCEANGACSGDDSDTREKLIIGLSVGGCGLLLLGGMFYCYRRIQKEDSAEGFEALEEQDSEARYLRALFPNMTQLRKGPISLRWIARLQVVIDLTLTALGRYSTVVPACLFLTLSYACFCCICIVVPLMALSIQCFGIRMSCKLGTGFNDCKFDEAIDGKMMGIAMVGQIGCCLCLISDLIITVMACCQADMSMVSDIESYLI